MTQNNAQTLRARLLAARQAIPEADRDRGGLLMRARLFTWLGITRDFMESEGMPPPARVAAYWAIRDEPDLLPLLEQWDEAGVEVLLPVVANKGEPLEFHRWHADDVMTAGAFGIMEPPRRVPVQPDVILVPTLGFTKEADRLGYGQGYYDRSIHALVTAGHRPVTIGIAWNQSNITSIDPGYRPQGHDQRLDAILTPAGWVPKEPDYIELVNA